MATPIWIPNQPLTFRTQAELDKYNEELLCANCAVDEQFCFKFAANDYVYAQFLNLPDVVKIFSCEYGYYYSQSTMEVAGGIADFENGNMHFPGGGSGGFILPVNPTTCGYPATLGWQSVAYNQTLLLKIEVYDVQTPGEMKVYFTDCGSLAQSLITTITTPGTYYVPWNYTYDGWFEFLNTGGNEMTFRVNGFYSPIQILNNEQLACIELTCDSICKKTDSKECIDTPLEIILNYMLQVDYTKNYVLTFEVSNCTQGYLTLNGESTTLYASPTTFAGNGQFTAEFNTYVPDRIKLTGNDGWDGCITNIKLSTRCVDALFNFYDENGELIGLQYADIYGDYLTLSGFNPSIWFDAFLENSIGKCFTLTLSANCGNMQMITNYGDSQSWNVPDANFNGSYTENYDSTLVLEEDTTWTVSFADTSNWDFKGNCFRIEIDILDVTQPNELLFFFFGVQLLFGSNITQPGTITLDPVYVDDGDPSFVQWIQFHNRTGRVKIDSLKIYYSKKCLGADGQDLVSQCMQYIGWNPEPCMTLMQSGVDAQLENTYTPVVEFGFLWYPLFYFSMREYVVMHNPKWDGKSEKYRYNNGFVKQTSAMAEKKWDCTIHRVDENMHDAIAIMTKLDWIRMTTVPNYSFETYISIENDYSPNWNKTAKTLTADGSFEIVKKYSATKFHNNNP